MKNIKMICKSRISLGLIILMLFYVCPVFAQQGSGDSASTVKSKKTNFLPPLHKKDTPVKTVYDTAEAQVEAVADSLEYVKGTQKLIGRGNVVISYQDIKLVADYAEVDTAERTAYAKGHVIVFDHEKPTLQGEEIAYDFKNSKGSSPSGRAMEFPWYAKGKDIQQIRNGVATVRNASVTTCNLEKPHYEIRCKKATVYTGDKIIMWNTTVYVLGVPVFWWPYMIIPMDWNIPFNVNAGYRSKFGAYIELTKGIAINKHLKGYLHADWRAKRGFGGGYDQYYNFGKWARGNVKLYWTQDKEAPTPGYTTSDGTLNPFAQREDRDRGRITWRHRTDITPNTNVILRYNRLADEYFLQDFFEKEYREAVEQDSFVTATHNTEQYGAMVHLQKRMNSFESLVERLPQLRLDWKNQPFLPKQLDERVYNESRISFDNLSKRYSRSSESQQVKRFDAYTRWYVPLKWKEIKLTPFTGVRGTGYSRQKDSRDGKFRTVIQYGADLRTQFYKTYPITFDKLGVDINQLRHVIEPSVTYEAMMSTLSNEKINYFDTTDTLDDSSQVVFGLENRLQTKRMIRGKMQRVDVVSLNTYMHFEISPLDSTIDGSKFTILSNELTLRPYEWLQYQIKVDYDFAREYLKFCNQDIVIHTGKWRFLFGHRYNHAFFNGFQRIDRGQQFVFDTQYVLNKLWSLGGYIRWDSSRDGLQEWQVSAIRDLHDFILDFGFNVRDSLIDDANKMLYFNLRLKAMPTLRLGVNGGRATFSEPRIGETVEGASQDRGRFLATDELSHPYTPQSQYQQY